MIEITNVDAYGFDHAIRGVRNNRNTWEKSDTHFNIADIAGDTHGVTVGPNDLELMKKLAVAGGPHAKYMRYIMVYCDINAPMYWWKEFDTYKVGTVRNSCSTMNTVMSKPFELSDFAWDHMDIEDAVEELKRVIETLNKLRDDYLEWTDKAKNADHEDAKDFAEIQKKHVWYSLIQLLPSSYMQKATILMNYQNLRHMYKDRKNHKLQEWRLFCDWAESLPYSDLIAYKN